MSSIFYKTSELHSFFHISVSVVGTGGEVWEDLNRYMDLMEPISEEDVMEDYMQEA